MKKYRVLIADDDANLLESMSIRLMAEGFEVLKAMDGYQSLAFARTHLPDLVVLDIGMPAGDGFSVHERMDRMFLLQNVPVIYVTGSKSPEIDQTAHRMGAFHVLHKPFDSNELIETIRGALGERPQEAAVPMYV